MSETVYGTLVSEVMSEVVKRLAPQKPTALLLGGDTANTYLTQRYNFLHYSDNGNKDEAHDAVIICDLGVNSLVLLSLGIAIYPQDAVIMAALLEGKAVYLPEEAVRLNRYKNTANMALYAKLKGCLQELNRMGIRIPPTEAALNGTTLKRTLITESMVEKLCRQGEKQLSIPLNAVVTPLAQDFIKANNISVTRT